MLRMLIVDDDYIHCQGIDHLSRQYVPELETTLCDDSVRALELLKTQKFDILFVDINMPVLSGLDIVERILPEQPDLQVVVYTAHSEFEYTKRAMRLGVRHYILKPIRVEEFRSELELVIGECRERSADRFRDFVSKTYYGTSTGEPSGFDGFPCEMVLADFESSVLSASNPEESLPPLVGDAAQVILLNECQLIVAGQQLDTAALAQILAQWTDVGFVVVDCGSVTEAKQLPAVFKKVTDLLAFRFYMENQKVYCVNETFVSEWSDEQRHEDLTEAAELVNRGKFEEAERAIVRFFASVQQSGHYSDLYVKYLVVDFLRHLQLHDEDGEALPGTYVQQVFSSKNADTLCAWCCETVYRVEQERSEAGGRQVIDRAIEILRAECHKNISLSQLAERVYLSPSYLSYLFKKNTGESYIKFFTGLRMKKAKELLVQTNLKVGEIGKQVGYTNTSYFCILFRDFYGMSPSQYREAQIR